MHTSGHTREPGPPPTPAPPTTPSMSVSSTRSLSPILASALGRGGEGRAEGARQAQCHVLTLAGTPAVCGTFQAWEAEARFSSRLAHGRPARGSTRQRVTDPLPAEARFVPAGGGSQLAGHPPASSSSCSTRCRMAATRSSSRLAPTRCSNWPCRCACGANRGWHSRKRWDGGARAGKATTRWAQRQEGVDETGAVQRQGMARAGAGSAGCAPAPGLTASVPLEKTMPTPRVSSWPSSLRCQRGQVVASERCSASVEPSTAL